MANFFPPHIFNPFSYCKQELISAPFILGKGLFDQSNTMDLIWCQFPGRLWGTTGFHFLSLGTLACVESWAHHARIPTILKLPSVKKPRASDVEKKWGWGGWAGSSGLVSLSQFQPQHPVIWHLKSESSLTWHLTLMMKRTQVSVSQYSPSILQTTESKNK